jgi:hypothetical protein
MLAHIRDAGFRPEKYPLNSSTAAVSVLIGDQLEQCLVKKDAPEAIHSRAMRRNPHALLWQERQLLSVANLTRQDGRDFLKIAPQAEIRTETTALPLVRPTTS